MIVFENTTIKISDFSLKIENLRLDPPNVVAVVGDNGSGKTVFLKSIIGFTRLSKGEIYINTIPNKKNKWQKSTGVYFDNFQLIPYLKPKEFFQFLIKIKKLDKIKSFKIIDKFSEKLNLQHENKYIRELSKGTQKKIGIISSLLGFPSLVIWDEPFSNLDANSIDGLNEIIKEYFHSDKERLLIYATNMNVGHYSDKLKIAEGKLLRAHIINE